MKMDADYFIRKFEAIPEEKWCVSSYGGSGIHCALGHCGEDLFDPTDESNALGDIFCDNDLNVAQVNDHISDAFPQPTPKQRILAALHAVKEKEGVCS